MLWKGGMAGLRQGRGEVQVNCKAHTVFTIDHSNQLLDFPLEVLVSFEIISTWDYDLQKDCMADELWVMVEKFVESVQLLR